MSTNRDKAYGLSISLKEKLSAKDPKFLQQWIKVYQEMKDWGFFIKVPSKDLKKTLGYHYICTFGVKQPQKLTQPYRLVFKANQKIDSGLTLKVKKFWQTL